MITESALNILSNPWVWAAVVIAVSALLVLSVWRGQESAEDGARQIRQMQEDPDFGARREPIYAGLLSAYRRGDWRANPPHLAAQWYGDLPCFREQTGVLTTSDADPGRSEIREVFLFDGGEWVRTHTHAAGSPSPGVPDDHVITTTSDSRLPVDLRWNKRGADPAQVTARDARGEHYRQVLLRADVRLRRATLLWRWAYRAALTGVVGSVVAGILGDSVHEGLTVAGVLGIVLLVPLAALLRWVRITALRRRGRAMLTHENEPREAAAWVSREVLAQWRAGGYNFWEFGPALPRSMAWSWRKDPRQPIIVILGVCGLVGVILGGIAGILALEWIDSMGAFPTALVVSAVVLAGCGALAGWLSKRPDRDYARFGELMDQLRHAEDLMGPHQVPAWDAPKNARLLLPGHDGGVHEHIAALRQLSRPWHRRWSR